MRFQLTAVGLACVALLSACGGANEGRKAQFIGFVNPGPQTLPATAKALGVTSSSNLPVTVTSDTPTICSIVDGKVLPLSKGACSITALQAGDGNYLPARVQQAFQIAQGVNTITFNSPGDLPIADTPPELKATSSSGLPVTLTSYTPTICTVSGTTLTLVSGGQCEIGADQEGNTDYVSAHTQVKFKVIDSALPIASGYASAIKTLDDGAIQTYAAHPTTVTVAPDGSTYTFSMTKQSDVANFGGYYGFRFFAPGVTDFVKGGDTTAGVRIGGQTALKFNLKMNPEMLTAGRTKLRVWLVLGHYHLWQFPWDPNSGLHDCNVTLEKFITPTFSGPGVMQEQSIDLTDFIVSNSCDAGALDPATELRNYPVSQIEFNVPDVNDKVPDAGTSTYTTSVTVGKVSFQ